MEVLPKYFYRFVAFGPGDISTYIEMWTDCARRVIHGFSASWQVRYLTSQYRYRVMIQLRTELWKFYTDNMSSSCGS
jgi:hypothetical protein